MNAHFYRKYAFTCIVQENSWRQMQLQKLKQEGQRCPKRRVAQAAISLVTAVITFRNKERNVRSDS